jgi:hypothetical protein
MFEWAIAIRDNGQQTLAIFGGRKDTDGLSHAHRLAFPPPACAALAKRASRSGEPRGSSHFLATHGHTQH